MREIQHLVHKQFVIIVLKNRLKKSSYALGLLNTLEQFE